MTDLDTAVVDLDGTLIDSSYHHVLAWSQAFAQAGIPVESWRIHRLMGMGGDKLVAAATNDAVEAGLGDTLRALWKHNYGLLLHYVHPLEGAVTLLRALEARGLNVVIASSGDPSHTQRALELLRIRDEFPVIDANDASATKPEPDLIRVAVEEVAGDRAVVIGDTRWDIEAAARSGFPAIALCTGGIDWATLSAAAAAVFATPRELAERLDGALASAANHAPTRPTKRRLQIVGKSP